MKTLLAPRSGVSWLVLGASVFLTVVVSWGLHQQTESSARRQFELQARSIVNDIEARLKQHEQILLAGAGLFDASENVTRANWQAFVERLKLHETYPGIQGVGFSKIVQPGELPAHIASIRADGFPEFNIRPAGDRPLYSSIIFIEPFVGRNLAAFGYDMFSESTRNKALRRAGEEGTTAMTGKVKLVQETHGKEQAGFLMYVPVYDKSSSLQPGAAPAQRWQRLRGFVYSPYRVNDLMRGILGAQTPGIDFLIHDGNEIRPDSRMYDSAAEHDADPVTGGRFQARHAINLFGNTWTISLHSRPAFDVEFRSIYEILVLVLGLGISLALFALTRSLVTRRERALKLAESMTVQIRESEQRFRHMLDNSPTAARIALAGGRRVAFFNARYTKLINAAREDAAGVDPSRYYASRTVYEEVVSKLQGGEDVLDRLVELNIPGAGTKWALASYFRMQYEGQPAVLGWFHDITAQRNAEAALRDQAQHTQAILDNAADGIITIDDHGSIASCNRAAERIFGYAANELIGNNIKLLMPEPYHSEHDGYLSNYRNSGHARIIGIGREVTGQRRDGSTFPMDLAVSEISHGQSRMFVGLVRDITERKRAERMKSEFVSTVSHELRTPLTSISGSLGLLVGGAMGALPGPVKSLLDIAHKNSQRLSVLINDLLDMEKIAAGKMQFNMTIQTVMPLLEQAIATNRAYGEQHQVGFVLTDRDDSVSVNIDGQRLLQILSNFLSNAAKFSPAGGTVEVSAQRRDNWLRIAVRDQGPGIPPDFHDRIFQKFSQADSSDSRQKGGTGLGLAITKELAERMGGRVGFETMAGQGTTFYCDLPIANTQREMPA